MSEKAEPAECECWDWCSDGTHRREEMLAGHHFRCAKFESEFQRRALLLIEQLRDAMRDWGNEEDGIPEEAWEAWAIANAVINGCAEKELKMPPTGRAAHTMKRLVRLLVSWPIALVGVPVAAWADASDAAEPDRYPARERVLFYLSDWWQWVCTGRFHSERMVMVDKANIAMSVSTDDEAAQAGEAGKGTK